MAVPDSTPPRVRASDADRECAIRALQDGSAEGRLSHETFIRRVDVALQAQGTGQLTELVSDLPPGNRLARAAVGAVAKWSALLAQLQAVWRAPRLPRLFLPRGDCGVFTIGRAPGCDLVLADLTVSGCHAELRRAGDGWLLADLGSTNGTRVNGWRVAGSVTVVPGDWVTFGRVGFQLADQRTSRLRPRQHDLHTGAY